MIRAAVTALFFLATTAAAQTIVFYGTPEGSAWRGFTFGAEEAAKTAKLLGVTVAAAHASTADELQSLLGRGDVAGVVTSASRIEREAIAPLLRELPLLVLARDGGSVPNEFALLPEGDALVWHPSLTRYGAREVNERYEARFDQPIDEIAWAGWLAVKLIAEALLRDPETPPLERVAAVEIDGHKGVVLYFENRRLVQPLYRVSGEGAAARVEEIAD